MYKYDKSYFDKRAKETGFIRDNLEKVFRLADILEYINRNPLHKDCLALKGDIAINLAMFNMPRLSVDIDLDFCKPVSREEMLEYRKKINEDLVTFNKDFEVSIIPISVCSPFYILNLMIRPDPGHQVRLGCCEAGPCQRKRENGGLPKRCHHIGGFRGHTAGRQERAAGSSVD